MRSWIVAALLLGGCGRHDAPSQPDSPGARLEAAAVDAGLVTDPAKVSLTGAWSRDTDRVCIVPGTGGKARIGVLIDYGEGQGCAASGTVERSGGKLDLRLGSCRIAATFDGERIVFPAEVPAECDPSCAGRASLAALSVDRQSDSVSEAATLRAPSGRLLCGAPD